MKKLSDKSNGIIIKNKILTKNIFDKVSSEKEPYEVEILKHKFIVLPNVFSPKYFTDTQYFSEILPKIIKNKKLLEIGSGTGIVSIFCALNGAKVTASDINTSAVENTKINVKLSKTSVDVREGNLFEPIKIEEKFDYIFWNHPFNPVAPPENKTLLLAGFDDSYKATKKFIRESKNYLLPGGRTLLGTGDYANLEELESYAKEQDFTVRILNRNFRPTEYGSSDLIEYLLYEFTPNHYNVNLN